MAEWRDILERAADNLSIDQAPFRQQPAGWPAQARGTREGSFVASRDLLTRELQAAPGKAQYRSQAPAARSRAPITQAIVQPVLAEQLRAQVQAPVAKKSRAGREIAALTVSVSVVAMAVFGIFALLH